MCFLGGTYRIFNGDQFCPLIFIILNSVRLGFIPEPSECTWSLSVSLSLSLSLSMLSSDVQNLFTPVVCTPIACFGSRPFQLYFETFNYPFSLFHWWFRFSIRDLRFSQRWRFRSTTFVLWRCVVFAVGYQRFGGPCCLHLQGEVLDF